MRGMGIMPSGPGPNDPDTAYPDSGGGGASTTAPFNVELADGYQNPVLSFTDPTPRNRLYANITGEDGTAGEVDFELDTAGATAKLVANTDGFDAQLALLLLTTQGSNELTQSSVVASSENGTAFVRVTVPADQTEGAIIVANVDTSNPQVSIYPTGDIESHIAGAGLLLKSPDGTRYRVKVANDGTVSAVAAP
jgi:hypothetical protein